MKYSLVFIGCGNLGSAILSSILANSVIEPSKMLCILPKESPDIARIESAYGVKCIDHIPQSIDTDAVLITVKPQVLAEIAPSYVGVFNSEALIMSIVAGKTMHYYTKYFPHNPIIRLMPNINLLKNMGVTIAMANNSVNSVQKNLCASIFKPTGVFEWVEDEEMMDLVIPIAASAPAFYCYMCEIIVDIAVSRGVERHIAQELAQYALAGTGAVLQDLGTKPETLRAMVTSYKGTTQAALDAFNEGDTLRNVMRKAFDAAITRSKELAE